MSNKSKKILGGIIIALVSIVLVNFIVSKYAKSAFKTNARTEMERHIDKKTLEFSASVNGQLVLVRQMMKSPAIVEYMINPYDKEIKKAAFKEFEAYSNSFLSKSVFWISKANMEFWSGMQFSYIVDPDNPDDYWFNMTLYETEEYNFNINYNPVLDTTMLWLNAVVRDSNRNPVGMVGTGIPLTDFINTMYSGLEDYIEMYLYNDLLEITGAEDSSILKDKLNVTDRIPFLTTVDNVPKEVVSYSRRDGEYVLAPIDLVNWHMVLYTNYSHKLFFKYAIRPFIISVVVVLIVLALFLVIVNMVNQLTILNNAVVELSSGNADLTKRISMKSKSVFKIFNQLVESMNNFIKKLQEIVSEVKNARNDLDRTGHALNDCTDNTTNAISQISAIIERFDKSISTQTESVAGTAGIVGEISTNINSLGNMIMTQTNSVSQASSAVVQMVGNINSVNASVTQLSESFQGLQDKTLNGVHKQEDVNNRILKIQEQSNMLQDANTIISSIAEQTNLLAMNAAIEAAHAGEAGKGFSVVADEIRKLSENSSAQSKTIGDQLTNIQAAVTEIVAVSQESRDMLNSLSSDITATNQLVEEITSAMQEQKNGSQQINESLEILNNNSNEVRYASQKMEEGNNTVLSQIADLKEATNAMQEGMAEMSGGAYTITHSGQKLSDLAEKMAQSINNIGSQLDQFKV